MTAKMYSIATEYQTYLTERSNSSKENRADQSHNIFQRNKLNNQKPKDLFGSKNYEIVGLKELKSLESKIRKGKKNTYRKETYLRQDTSREDDKEKLLTKIEVLDSLPKLQLKKVHRAHLKTLLTEFNPSQTTELKDLQANNLAREFSLSRLKEVIEARNEEWKKIQVHTGRQDDKFPSIYRSVDTYRSKMEKKLKTEKLQDLNNQNSQKWPSILRKDLSLADVALKKPIARTFHDEGEFTAHGTSKLKAEQQWLSRKSQDGYYFKKLIPPPEKPPLQQVR